MVEMGNTFELHYIHFRIFAKIHVLLFHHFCQWYQTFLGGGGGETRETKRSGNFRIKKGEEFHASRDIFIREQLFLGCSNATGALPSIGEVTAREAIPLPISTRGVGTGSVYLAKTVSKLTPAIDVDVRAIYRAGLGLAEARMSRQQGLFTKTNPLSGYSKDLDVSNPLIHTVRHIPIVPEPFFLHIEGISIYKLQLLL